MNKPIEFRIDQPLYQKLHQHLFPGDDDEHGAVIAAGIVETPRGIRLLAREVFLARDGIDYVPGTRGYRALTAKFVAEISGYCAEQNLCYLAVHCHGGTDQVCFSADDMASHERGYPALLDITRGGPVGAMVFAKNAVAGDIWTPSGRFPLNHMTIIGSHIRNLYPSPQPRPRPSDPMYDRHVRMFGDVGQEIFANLKVGIIGLGGGGSLINEWLSHLGVGHIVAIDFDRVELTNRPRIVGTNPWDAMTWLVKQPIPWLQKLGKRLAAYKVHVARRVAKEANPSIRYDAVVGDIVDEAIARLLVDADFLFLAADSMQSRLVFNALVHQYLIPGIQIGAKVPVNKQTKQVGDIFTATRPVLPNAYGGCLHCHELIPAGRLQQEALTEEERRTQRYVEDEEGASQFCKETGRRQEYSRETIANKRGGCTSTQEFARIRSVPSLVERPMTPEEKKELDTHVKAIAKILYKNTPSEKIETFEGIEIAVRDQVLEHVSPKIAFFLSEKRREQQKDASEPSEAV